MEKQAVKMMDEILKKLNLILCHKRVKVQYVPDHSHLGERVELWRTVGRTLHTSLTGEKIESVL